MYTVAQDACLYCRSRVLFSTCIFEKMKHCSKVRGISLMVTLNENFLSGVICLGKVLSQEFKKSVILWYLAQSSKANFLPRHFGVLQGFFEREVTLCGYPPDCHVDFPGCLLIVSAHPTAHANSHATSCMSTCAK